MTGFGFMWAAPLVVAVVFAAGCGGSDKLSRAEVDEAIDEAIAAAVADLPTESGLSAAEVDQAISAAVQELLSSPAEAPSATAEPAAGAPSRSDPAAYTKFVVDEAIALYRDNGLDAVLEHVNDPDNVDGQWYVFVVDENDTVIGHYEPDRRGSDLKGWVGTDLNGYVFGADMLSATEDGRWVGYMYRNPDSEQADEDLMDAAELKIAWTVRNDGLLFGSGWYISVDDFITEFTDEVAENLDARGADATIAHYANPQSLGTGLREAVTYYNQATTAGGTWVGFFAHPDGTIISSNDVPTIGANIADILGPAVLNAGEDPAWFTQRDNPEGTGPPTMRIRAVQRNGAIFGTGEYHR